MPRTTRPNDGVSPSADSFLTAAVKVYSVTRALTRSLSCILTRLLSKGLLKAYYQKK